MAGVQQTTCGVLTRVDVKAVTWSKDSHGLFDFESKTFDQRKFKVEESSIILRNDKKGEITISSLEEASLVRPSEEHALLVYISAKQLPNKEVRYELNVTDNVTRSLGMSPPEDREKNGLYLIVRSLKNSEGLQKGYTLSAGDVIKMGRMEYSVLQICNEKERLSAGGTLESVFKEFNSVYNLEEELKGSCRYCLLDSETESNFLIAPCKCSGSCKLIHIDCLRMWLSFKLTKKTNSVTLINVMNFQCEICKYVLPSSVKRGEEEFETFGVERPAGRPYIILESLVSKCQKNIQILEASLDVIRIGRGHECEVRMSDISVSRFHAQIKYENGNFVIFDNQSKFGTLIKVKNNLPVTTEKIAVQVGRTVITYMLKPKELKDKQKTLNSFPILAGNISQALK